MIRWEQDKDELDENCSIWHGWVRRVRFYDLLYIPWKEKWGLCDLCATNRLREYARFYSAKRGAERLLKRFLKDAGLEVAS